MSPALNRPLRPYAQAVRDLAGVSRSSVPAPAPERQSSLDRQFAKLTRDDPDLSPETIHARRVVRAKGGMSPIERITGVRLS